MKKILLMAIAVVFTVATFAQDQQHLKFKGVPIDGTLKQFVANMKAGQALSPGQRRVTVAQMQDGTAALVGDFAGYKNCIIVVSTLKNKDLVNTIGVMFPEHKTWNTLEANYMKLKEMLTTKYGKPVEVIEEFQGLKPRDDSSRLYELKMDRCVYQSTFNAEEGGIILRLMHDDYLSCHVMLGYYDKINGLEMEAAAMEDL